ncbi:MFS general substrate transporter [Aspergillus steynii IBT 23096]|uniref:MFS general substrate transporter n=1 Tax=Aspergillus steynii IBT 23096 TaxID=1392250 RepID=A0A2I2FW33_9EURO|nr:MFS general substrate transporter [Aspergillus steynii IBT 23096]PLB44838.1 MFS general substrate transporter [Aspergillus steynii IBT 23096]
MGSNSESSLAEAMSRPHSSFSQWQKRCIILTAAGGSFFSSLSAHIYFPALNTVAEDMGVSSSLINLTVTSYMIFQGVAPMFFGDFADQTGRRPTYIICFIIYIASNIGLALQKDYAALIVLRCLQSAGISSSMALSAATVADVSTKEERGSYMGIVMAGNFLGPAIGPTIGGLLAQYLGWRSIFWFLAIVSGLYLLPLLFFFPETARNVVGDGSSPAQSWNRPFIHYFYRNKATKNASTSSSSLDRSGNKEPPKRSHKIALPNPLKPFKVVFHLNSIIVLLVTGVILGSTMTILASITEIYTAEYNLDTLQIGLCYLTTGTGSILSSFVTGRLLDWNFRRSTKKLTGPNATPEQMQAERENVSCPKARSEITIPLVVMGSLTILAFGWLVHFGQPLAAPEVFLFFIGMGQTGAFSSTSTLLVDLHPTQPAAATAANNLVRSLFSAAASAAIVPMLNAMGRGWAFTLVTFMLLSTIPLFLFLCGIFHREKTDDSVEV